jgi:hypothetical protein
MGLYITHVSKADKTGRANMNPELFKSFVIENNMNIISQNTIQFEPVGFWSGIDILSYFSKS